MTSPQNIAASIKQRLLNRSKSDNRPFHEVLQYFAMERFLYRLSVSNYAEDYILKGALMLRAWNSPESRPTMDIDMLGKSSNDMDTIICHIQSILSVDAEADGLRFDAHSIQTEKITEHASYEGIRVVFRGLLGTAKVRMQLDIGFGDIVYPKPEKNKLPSMLNFSPPILLCYSRESAIAEKFEAMIKLGQLNSRMKDFYDIWFLSQVFDFEYVPLSEAIRQTFKRRGTEISDPIVAFSTDFTAMRQVMWMAFRRRLKLLHIPSSFQKIVADIEGFLRPVIHPNRVPHLWKAKGPWRY